MESATSRKKKKSVAFQHNHSMSKQEISVEVMEKNLYRAASTGRYNDLNEILEKLNSQTSQEELENIITNIHAELKLNNIALTDDVEVQLYKYFFKRYFFAKPSTDCYKISDIKYHIKTLACIVDCVKYFSDEEEILIFCLKFSIKEIHLLKHLLRSTYDVLPWEEIEFYLLCFIISSTEQHDLNVFFKTTLNKSDLINHLTDFVKLLEKLQMAEKNELSKLPELTRDEAVRKIIENSPNFRILYRDIDFIRDVYSLFKIRKFAKLSQSTDPQEIRGDEMIVRVLCLISEQLKYTLESPKLSPIKGDLIILSLAENSRRAIWDLRNSIDSEETLMHKWKLIKGFNKKFLQTIRDDLKRIAQVADDLLLGHIIRLLKHHFGKIEKYPDFLKQMETFFAIFNTVSNSSSIDKTLYDKPYEILQKLPTEIQAEGDFLQKLKKIVTTKTELRPFEKERMLIYILKPEARDIFSNYMLCSRLSSDDIRDLLDIVLSIQKKVKNSIFLFRDEIGLLIAEVINLLELEIDNVDDWREKIEEAIKINQELFLYGEKESKSFSEKVGIEYKSLMSERILTLRKVMNNKSQLTYARLKNDHKSLEIMKSLVLDILSLPSIIESNEDEKKKDSQNNSMLMDWLKNDYELNDLIFNSTITVFHVANSLIEDDTQNLMHATNNKPTKNRTSFSDQFMAICKKLKICSKLTEGDFGQFKEFLGMGADIRSRDGKKSTYLHRAAEKSDTSQIDYLCNEGLRVYCKDIKHQTPLHIAAKNGNEQVVLYFIQKAKDVVDNVDNFGRTALHLAVLNERRQIVECLVKAGSDPSKKDYLGFTSSVYAVLGGNKEVLSLLLLNDAQQSEIETLFNIAIDQNSAEILDFLLSEKCVTLDDKIRDVAVSSAVSNGQVEIVDKLLSSGARPSNVSILIAVQKNYDLIVEQLLQNEAKLANAVNPENRKTALHYAAQDGNDHIVDILMQHKANINVDKERNTPLHVAVENRHVNIVKTLLNYEKGVEVINAMNSKRHTALHIAAEKGELEIAELLLQHWAYLDNEDFSVSPLQLAKSNGNEEIAQLLVKNGAKYAKTPVPSPSPIPKGTTPKKYIGVGSSRGITLTKKMLENPTIIIYGVDQDDVTRGNENLINKIIEQNEFERNVKYKLEIVGKYPKTEKYNIILVLEKSVYNKIMSTEMLKIGWNICRVSNYYFIFRCHKCAGFGHHLSDCENEQVCGRCSGAHHRDECTNKKFKCLHCVEKNKTRGLTLDIEHSPLDQFCPWYRKLLKDKYEKQKKNSMSTYNN
ncbi:uncharacterized protein LOC123307459 [Coccinella septempunctata]|uniref:uncharacterized protein LOC123307459 n=1 Tax=Coccinella septempunctata TaxID=41139 RepID=UPI001D07FF39|nr:uncharacterized protein LOC123307459 [Coccinella septempunctata]